MARLALILPAVLPCCADFLYHLDAISRSFVSPQPFSASPTFNPTCPTSARATAHMATGTAVHTQLRRASASAAGAVSERGGGSEVLLDGVDVVTAQIFYRCAESTSRTRRCS